MGRTVRAHIVRTDPAREATGVSTFEVETHPHMSVLDLLFRIVEEQDADLAFRFSCRVGMCGSCGMLVNGRESLACQTAVAGLGEDVRIAPLNHLPVQRDLLVDLGPFFDRFTRVDGNAAGDPDAGIRHVTPDPGDLLTEVGNCISCGLCVSACSILSYDSEYLGPAALYRALLLIEDKREADPEGRLSLVTDEHGIWRCHTHNDCLDVCPKDLPLTQAIQRLKRLAVRRAVGLPVRRDGQPEDAGHG